MFANIFTSFKNQLTNGILSHRMVKSNSLPKVLFGCIMNIIQKNIDNIIMEKITRDFLEGKQ